MYSSPSVRDLGAVTGMYQGEENSSLFHGDDGIERIERNVYL